MFTATGEVRLWESLDRKMVQAQGGARLLLLVIEQAYFIMKFHPSIHYSVGSLVFVLAVSFLHLLHLFKIGSSKFDKSFWEKSVSNFFKSMQKIQKTREKIFSFHVFRSH